MLIVLNYPIVLCVLIGVLVDGLVFIIVCFPFHLFDKFSLSLLFLFFDSLAIFT